MKNFLRIAAYCLGFLLTWALFFYLLHRPDFFEPDRFYHFALLREMVSHSSLVLRTWTQVPLLGWDQYFSDKEYLFHLLLFFPAKLWGEAGILATCALLAALVVWLPFVLSKNKFFALALSILILLVNPFLLFRFSLVRPHVFAVLIFSALIISATFARPRLSLVLSFLFALAYHALYLVLLMIVVCAIFRRRREAAFIACGLVAGILVNPYFPANLIQGVEMLVLALRARDFSAAFQLRLGAELLPLSLNDFLWSFGGVLVLFGISVALYNKRESLRSRSPEWGVLVLTSILWLASLWSPRALEFVAPLTAFSLWIIWRHANLHKQGLILGLIALAPITTFISFCRVIAQPGAYAMPSPMEMTQLLGPLPKAEPLRIFYTNWGLGPYILYELPHAEITDVLDPSFLFFRSPRKSILISALTAGRVKDPVPVVKREFNSNYILAEASPLLSQLLQDPRAELISSNKARRLALFRLH